MKTHLGTPSRDFKTHVMQGESFTTVLRHGIARAGVSQQFSVTAQPGREFHNSDKITSKRKGLKEKERKRLATKMM
jgi:hypothetical protein